MENNAFAHVHTVEEYKAVVKVKPSLREREAWLNWVDPSTLDANLREQLYMYCSLDVAMLGPGSVLRAAAEKLQTPTTDGDQAIARMLVGGSGGYVGAAPVQVMQEFAKVSDNLKRGATRPAAED